jgi:hypothetical protein
VQATPPPKNGQMSSLQPALKPHAEAMNIFEETSHFFFFMLIFFMAFLGAALAAFFIIFAMVEFGFTEKSLRRLSGNQIAIA